MRPGVDVVGAPPAHRRKFRLGQRGLQLDDDLPRDLVLKVERVAAVDVVAAGPELVAAFRLDKLDGDPHLRFRAARAAGHHIADAELGADLPDFRRVARVQERRGAGDHEEAGHAGEQRDDVLGEPVDDQFERAVVGHVLERQHGDRRPVGDQLAAACLRHVRPTPARRRRRARLRSPRRRSGSPCGEWCAAAPGSCRCRRWRSGRH